MYVLRVEAIHIWLGVWLLGCSLGRLDAREIIILWSDSGIFPDCGPGAVYDEKEATCVQGCGDFAQVKCLPVREYCDDQTGRCADCSTLCQEGLNNETHVCAEFCQGNDTDATPSHVTSHVTLGDVTPRTLRGRLFMYFPIAAFYALIAVILVSCVLWVTCFLAKNLGDELRLRQVRGCCSSYAPVSYEKMETV